MDMDGMGGMGGMGEMSMSPKGVSATNMSLARGFWYFVVAAVALLLIVRLVNLVQTWSRLRRIRTSSVQFPTKPTRWFAQLWATSTAVCREVSYPQLYIPIRGLSWMTPPPMGRILVLLVYWAVIVYMMVKDAIVSGADHYERIGYRNAWVSVTQVPLLYLLASRTNVIAFITGTSYERLNWLHRWVARTLFVTATVHGFHFYASWLLWDGVEIEMEMMPMVKYGFGAWGILLWMTVTSFKPFRSMAYELFVIQHILAAVAFLCVIYTHVPRNAKYNVWFAIAALCFDRACRLALLFWQNVKLRLGDSGCKGVQRIGHQTQLSAMGDSMTVLTIKDVHFKWKTGQHLYLWLPRVGPFEVHPYTIASSHQMPDTCICNSIQLVVRSHSGFSKRLNTFVRKQEELGRRQTLRAFVLGPYGNPPQWTAFETLVLIAASTGASFTVPILESVLDPHSASCIKRVDFLLAARQGEEIAFYHERLHEAIGRAKSAGIELIVRIAVTGNGQLDTMTDISGTSSRGSGISREKAGIEEEIKSSESVGGIGGAVQPLMSASRQPLSPIGSDSHIHHSAARPDIARFIRIAVEATGGETGVAVCGGQSLVAEVRTCVAKLSDERAVHKGTGAQGIYLHVEEYSF
ncbi:ferric reductase like transmembrane component-domain-containing protein [Durotheca rogersii]|uniref:ferric reductase like transmembrane component-domain-containing protein n=1 Tax=Durotheca rogersii TaxID=419775 RepID=UPI00221ED679|nr:ferric reductase like transmembrane component-domain-containing protein [Durotheca rogersii]KAI5863303.1 ferric reductase like transmembrane component-domain-containing protein [Durotheca rogersii]